MTDGGAHDVLPVIAEARQRFLELVAEVRPELHRYCARMTGSVFDGEDVVQDTIYQSASRGVPTRNGPRSPR